MFFKSVNKVTINTTLWQYIPIKSNQIKFIRHS